MLCVRYLGRSVFIPYLRDLVPHWTLSTPSTHPHRCLPFPLESVATLVLEFLPGVPKPCQGWVVFQPAALQCCCISAGLLSFLSWLAPGVGKEVPMAQEFDVFLLAEGSRVLPVVSKPLQDGSSSLSS